MHEQEVIIVPVLFLMSFLVTLVFLLLLKFCPEKVDRLQPRSSRATKTRRNLQGIDGECLNIYFKNTTCQECVHIYIYIYIYFSVLY